MKNFKTYWFDWASLTALMILLFGFCNLVMAQTGPIYQHKNVYTGCGKPVGGSAKFSSVGLGDAYQDRCSDSTYVYTAVSTWTYVKGLFGQSGQGPKGDKGDTGPQGIPGTGGGGGNITIYTSALSMLKSTQTTGIAVTTSFHAGTNFGGDLWYVDGNTLTSDYVNHFKSNNGTVCWHRLMPDACLSDVDFGAPNGTKTLAQYGYTQSDVNLLFDPSYGIVTGDNADDAAHITTVKGWLKNYMCIFQSPVVINIKKDADMGKQNNVYGKSVVVNNGNGMRINMLGTNQTAIKRKAASFAEAEGNIGQGDAFGATSIHIDGYNVNGIEGANQTFSDIDASFGATVTRMHFASVDYPTKQYHSMMTTYFGNIIWSPIKGYQNNSMKDYPGGDENNSGGNMSLLMCNRVYATQRTEVGFETNRSSSPYRMNNIFEGQQGTLPRVGFLTDFGTSTTCKNGEDFNIHVEIECAIAAIQLKLPASGNYNIKQFWAQAQGTLIDVVPNGGGYPNITVEDMPWIPNGAKFNASTAYWYFLNSTENDIFNSSYWKNGILPNFLTQVKHTGGLIQKSNYPFKFEGSMTLNGKEVTTKP